MNKIHLTEKHCVPCEGGVSPLELEASKALLENLNPAWKLEDDALKIERKFKFKDFSQAMEFVNQVARIAESEGHHPEIEISYSKVEIELTTHAISGLSENDFIVAAKIDALNQ